MQILLPRGWVVETVLLTVGMRGSLHEPTWRGMLDRFGISAQIMQETKLCSIPVPRATSRTVELVLLPNRSGSV